VVYHDAMNGRVPSLESPIPIDAALRQGAALLAAAGVDNPVLDARLLLAHALAMPADRLSLERARMVPTESYAALLARRVGREPVALIIGRREFWSLEFEVSPATLVPRPDSETLIEAALAALPARAAVRRVLDLGTGTGCLLLAALSEYPSAWGLGIDRAPAASALAARNAVRLGLAGRAAFLCGDWATALGETARFDLVLCNPPYIASAAIAGLMPEVARHEPAGALDGGADGLDDDRRVVAALPALLAPGGVAVLELGLGQEPAVAGLARAAGLTALLARHDLGGVPRALVLRRAG
jgi:release factor glutamine methyltransferase